MDKGEIKCCGECRFKNKEEKITNNEDLFNGVIKIMSKMRIFKFWNESGDEKEKEAISLKKVHTCSLR